MLLINSIHSFAICLVCSGLSGVIIEIMFASIQKQKLEFIDSEIKKIIIC